MSATRAEKVLVQAGVGMVLEEKRANGSFQLVVVKLVEGGPAHSSSKIQVGGILFASHADSPQRIRTMRSVVCACGAWFVRDTLCRSATS